ncbi:hypothetical protein AB0H57_02345 [Micromonospora sp. NPDC050686]|uniref:hypothetical protein n=1 Tax=Micromonospora sp. NPDC050686 TaxID=3154631 RepID=UPI0033DE6038
MRRFPRNDARTRAVAATLAAAALLVALVVGRPRGVLAVALALLALLCATVAGVSVVAARQGDDREPVTPEPPRQPGSGPYRGDADTLETLADPEAVRALRERYRRLDGLSDR